MAFSQSLQVLYAVSPRVRFGALEVLPVGLYVAMELYR